MNISNQAQGPRVNLMKTFLRQYVPYKAFLNMSSFIMKIKLIHINTYYGICIGSPCIFLHNVYKLDAELYRGSQSRLHLPSREYISLIYIFA